MKKADDFLAEHVKEFRDRGFGISLKLSKSGEM